MSDDNWEKLESAFQQAVALEGDSRESFVENFSVSDPGLALQLRDLLAADANNVDGSHSPLSMTVDSLAGSAKDPFIGRHFGAWTITRRLAGGGMGAVFLAERADRQYAQTVAIKVMAAQLLATEAINRFRAERQILANLNHPYIAQLIDGGSTEDGLPYLVMEYVDGLPIDQHCDDNRLSIDQRLALFRKVCTAVDYAHRNLVVHRDLKPNNILVDANGNPKLLDFGIAKLLEAEAYQQTMAVTREGMRAMTPEYASPEQVRGQPVSVATDVYALGMLLYKLMTGASPYSVPLLTARDYEAAIVDSDPRKPSTAISAVDTPDTIFASRSVSLDRLRKQLAGDLDNIALKALQKEPDRRYATASTLSDDIGRYLAHEPIEARGDDWAYKARKFLVRNARGLAVTVTVVATMAALVLFYTVRLADERDRANLAAAQASEVSGFLTSLFESASPHESKGEVVSAVELLLQGSERIETLEQQPKVKAELMRIMASSMTALGHLEQSTAMLERVLAYKEAEDPPNLLSISQTTHDLAEAMRQNRDLEQAEHYERRTLEIAEQELGETDSDTAYVMSRLGVILFEARKIDEALELERRALDILIANGDGETSNAIDMRGNMANVLSFQGRYAEAEALHRETVALSIRVDGELHPNTIIRQSNLALVLTHLGKLVEAVDLFDSSIEAGGRVWLENYEQIAFMIASKAGALKRLGRLSDALAAYRAAQAMTRTNVGEDHLSYVARMRGTASALMDMRRYVEAEALFTDAVAIATRLQGSEGDLIAQLSMLMGQLNNERGRYVDAEHQLRRALLHGKQLSSTYRLSAMRELGRSLSAQGRFDEAEPLLLDALLEKGTSTGVGNVTLLPFLGAVTAHYRQAGNLDESLRYGEQIATIAASDEQPLHWHGALALAEYGATLRAVGDESADEVLYRANAVLDEVFGQ
ncbi:MAG TPA: serine/threonine-protein kinase [Woeseiaceae bacterium]|nr:serine/threonine-protein kinase [Woeseiaceae bacterium]